MEIIGNFRHLTISPVGPETYLWHKTPGHLKLFPISWFLSWKCYYWATPFLDGVSQGTQLHSHLGIITTSPRICSDFFDLLPEASYNLAYSMLCKKLSS